MSSKDIAVAVRGISKSYSLGQQEKQTTIREALLQKVRRPFQKPSRETFWALKDVDFDIAHGDVVGIIGRNGAGKSTLLKILSNITRPTSGYVDLFGRVGSLLEVGTGFHLELTGRENIFLNGAILGMRRREIEQQFDAIVDFSGVEKFLDTPVKRYSSGMFVRLAFAVAAHLNPDILIIDEVLAVGDAEFQTQNQSAPPSVLVSHQPQSPLPARARLSGKVCAARRRDFRDRVGHRASRSKLRARQRRKILSGAALRNLGRRQKRSR